MFSVPLDGVEQKPLQVVEVYYLVSQVGWKSGGLSIKCLTMYCKKRLVLNKSVLLMVTLMKL